MNYCPNCGVKLDASERFCHNCGITLQHHSNTQNTYNNVVSGQKSKFIAGLLAILLGTLGIHNFYLGYTKKAVAQLLLFVFFLGWVSFIWGIIDGIKIFSDKITCDANGVPLADNI